MERNHSIEPIIQATLYFHELFKKTLLASQPERIFTKTQMDLMITLHIEGGMNMSALSERVGIAPEQATRALKNLRERGLADTVRSDENRRMVIAQLTEEGALIMDEHLRAVEENLRASLDGLDKDEIYRLADAAETAINLMGKTGLRHVVPAPPKRRTSETQDFSSKTNTP